MPWRSSKEIKSVIGRLEKATESDVSINFATGKVKTRKTAWLNPSLLRDIRQVLEQAARMEEARETE